VELAHAKQYEQAIDFLKETSLKQVSRIGELEAAVKQAVAKEQDMQLQLGLKQTKMELYQGQIQEL